MWGFISNRGEITRVRINRLQFVFLYTKASFTANTKFKYIHTRRNTCALRSVPPVGNLPAPFPDHQKSTKRRTKLAHWAFCFAQSEPCRAIALPGIVIALSTNQLGKNYRTGPVVAVHKWHSFYWLMGFLKPFLVIKWMVILILHYPC